MLLSKNRYCTHCKKAGHNVNKCWKLNPEKVPEYLRRDKGEHLRKARRLVQKGQAYQYDPARIGFLDLPFEIRSLILKQCLSNEDVHTSYPHYIHALNDNQYDIGVQWSHPRRRKEAETSSLATTLDTNWPPAAWIERKYAKTACFNVLLTCRTLATEGMSILYEHNHFVTFQPLRFLVRFPTVIGAHFRRLRYLTMGLPSDLKLTTRHLPTFLDLFSDGLPNLRYLCLTVEYPNLAKPLKWAWADIERHEQEHRALIHTAAWIALRHPNLCEAVSPHEHNPRDEEEEPLEEGTPQIEEVKLISSMFKRNAYSDTFTGFEHCWKGPPFDPLRDTVLNCRVIRMAGWQGLKTLSFDAYVKELDGDDGDMNGLGFLFERFKFISDDKKRRLGIPVTDNNPISGLADI